MSLSAPGPVPTSGLSERVSKAATLAVVAVALPLQLWVDPAVGWQLRLAAAVGFGAALACGRRWRGATLTMTMAVGPLLPALLSRVVHVAAINAFYSVWLAAVFGALLPLTPRRHWALPPAWRIPLGVWALTLAAASPVMIVREAGLRLGTLRDTGVLDSWADLNTPQVESWILYMVLTQLVGLLWLEAVCSERADPRSPIPDPFCGLWIGTTLASLVALYQGAVDMAFLSGGVWPGLRRAAGTLLDANAFGTIAALGGPLAFVSMSRLKLRNPLPTQAAALALNWAGVWMSGSRTAVACGAFGTAALIYEVLRPGRRTDVGKTQMPSLVAAVAAVVLLLVLSAGAIGPFKRLPEGVGAGTRASLGGLWRRGGYGTVAVRMVRDYPLTGVGVGSFNWMAPDYWRAMANERLPFDNAQNWWRHQVAELGVVASMPILIWSALVGWLVVTRRAPGDARLETETLRGLLVGVGLASLVGVPTQNSIVLLTFFAVAARFEGLTRRAASARTAAAGAPVDQPWQRIAWAIGMVVALGYAGGHLALARGALKPLERAARAHRDYVTGTYPAEALPEGQFRWTARRATFVLEAPTRFLVIRYHVEHPDAGSRPVKLRIFTPCQTLADEFRTDSEVGVRAFELPDGQDRVEFETDVSRTWRPSSVGQADSRELGAAVEAAFVPARSVAGVPDTWVALKSCGSI